LQAQDLAKEVPNELSKNILKEQVVWRFNGLMAKYTSINNVLFVAISL